MLSVLIVALLSLSVAGVVWYFVGGVKIRPGWQNGQSPLARYLDGKRRESSTCSCQSPGDQSNALPAGFSIAHRSTLSLNQGEPR